MAFDYKRNLEGNSNPVMMFVRTTATEGNQPKKGDAVAISTGLAVKAGPSHDNIIGIAKENTITDSSDPLYQHVLVIVDPHATFEVPYTGSSKTSLGTTDLYMAFDLSNEGTLDLDNTTKGQFLVLEYDNEKETAVVKNNVPIL